MTLGAFAMVLIIDDAYLDFSCSRGAKKSNVLPHCLGRVCRAALVLMVIFPSGIFRAINPNCRHLFHKIAMKRSFSNRSFCIGIPWIQMGFGP